MIWTAELGPVELAPQPLSDVRLSNLGDITVLLGRNGSGKSRLLRALSRSDPPGRHYVPPERGGEIGYAPQYQQQEFTPQQRFEHRQQNFSPQYRDRTVARVQMILSRAGIAAGRDGGTPIRWGPIEQRMRTLLPDFLFRFTDGQVPYELRRDGGAPVQSVQELSSGEAEAFALGLDVLTLAIEWELSKQEPRVILLDEPDTHLHPDLQQRLAAFLVELTAEYRLQLVVATHSTTLLAALAAHGGERTRVIFFVPRSGSHAARNVDEAMRTIATCLGGHVLMGPLFGAPLLLVEGSDDLQIWSQVPRHGRVSLAAVPCDGHRIYEYQRRAEGMFAALRDRPDGPVGYALLDGDRPPPNGATQNHIRYLRLGCHEAENLYLTDEVLQVLKTDWPTAQATLAARAAEAGEKADILRGCGGWNRRTADLKSVITETARILDTQGVSWTLRLGKVLGSVTRPTGQIGSFLGNEVVDALWGNATP